jgi:hypothetical protein
VQGGKVVGDQHEPGGTAVILRIGGKQRNRLMTFLDQIVVTLCLMLIGGLITAVVIEWIDQ